LHPHRPSGVRKSASMLRNDPLKIPRTALGTERSRPPRCDPGSAADVDASREEPHGATCASFRAAEVSAGPRRGLPLSDIPTPVETGVQKSNYPLRYVRLLPTIRHEGLAPSECTTDGAFAFRIELAVLFNGRESRSGTGNTEVKNRALAGFRFNPCLAAVSFD